MLDKQELLDKTLTVFGQCFESVVQLHVLAAKHDTAMQDLRQAIERLGIVYNPTDIANRKNLSDIFTYYYSNHTLSAFVNRVYFKWRSRITKEAYALVVENMVDACTVLRDKVDLFNPVPDVIRSNSLSDEDMTVVLQNNPALVALYLIMSVPDVVTILTNLARPQQVQSNTVVING